MTPLNFDDDGQLGSMELYSLQLQKIVADFDDFDAVTKAYVDSKVSQAKSELTGGASEALDTFKELEDYLTASGTAGGLVEQINALSSQISAEASRAGTEEGKLDARVTSLENDTTNANDISGVQDELDATQQGAGLDLDGSYVADSARNYISGATSLKSADALLDSALKTEADRAIAEEAKISSELSGHITNYTSNKTTTDATTTSLSDRIATLESDPTTGASVTAVRNEVNSIETGAGLSTDGTYTATASSHYLTLASSLKDADDKLDAQLKAEELRASGAEAMLNNNLTVHIANYESEKKTNDQDKTAIGQRITDLDTSDIAEGDKLFYTDQRVKNASVHSYEYFNEDRGYDAPVEITVGTAFSALKAELQGIHAKEDTDDARHTDDVVALNNVVNSLNSEISLARAEEKKVQDDVNSKDSAMSGRVAVFEGQLNNGNVEGSEYYVDNLSVQGVVDDLRGAIDYVNGERFADKGVADTRHTASEGRHDASDGRHNSHDTKHASHEENLGELETTKFDKAGGEITGEVRVNLDASYFYLSSVWRIRTDAIGKRIVFEFNKDVTAYEGEGDWVSGIPFISSH